MPSTTLPNMSLIAPTPLQEPGPTWATDLNSSLSLIDAHDHTTGKGVKVPSAGLNINADLPFTSSGNYYGPTSAAYYGYHAQTAPTAGTHLNSTYVSAAGDIYYRNTAGNDVQLTSGNNIMQTGTGTYNGFYGSYAAAGPSANAVAYFRTPSGNAGGFEFHVPLGGGLTAPTNYSSASSVWGAAYYQNAAIGLGFVSFDPSQTTAVGQVPKGGFAVTPVSSLTVGTSASISFDTINGTGTAGTVSYGSGSYLENAFTVYAPSTTSVFQKLFGFNVPTYNRYGSTNHFTSPSSTLDVWYYNANTSTPHNQMAFRALSSASPGTGFGNRIYFTAATSSWAGQGNALPATIAIQGQIDSFFHSGTAAGAGLRLWGAYNGTASSTPGIELISTAAGAPSIGFGGAASTTANSYTFYGAILPNATGTLSLGTTSASWLQVGTLAVVSGSTMNITAPSGISLSGAITTSSTVTVSNTASATSLYPTATGSVPVAGTGGLFKNTQVTTWGVIPNSGGSPTTGFNVAGISWAGNVCTVTLTTAISTSAAVIATGNVNDGTNSTTVAGVFASSTSLVFNTYHNATTPSAQAFSFVIIGNP